MNISNEINITVTKLQKFKDYINKYIDEYVRNIEGDKEQDMFIEEGLGQILDLYYNRLHGKILYHYATEMIIDAPD